MAADAPPTSADTRRMWIIAAVALGLLLLLHFSPLRAWLEDIRALKERIDSYGWAADLVFVVACVLAIALGVPRLALCGLAGALFGFIEGGLLSLAASVLGSYLAFLLVRWGASGWAESKIRSADPRIRATLADPSIWGIFLARQMPFPGLVVNVLIGLLPVRHGVFLIGSALGYVPSTVIVSLAGSSLGKESLERAIVQISLAMAALAVLSGLMMWITRRGRDASLPSTSASGEAGPHSDQAR